MSADQHIYNEVAAYLDRAPSPLFDIAAVRRRAASPRATRRPIAAVLAVLALVPMAALAYSHRAEFLANFTKGLGSHGIIAPKGVDILEPASSLSLAEASRRASFHLVPPMALPRGARLRAIYPDGAGFQLTYTYGTRDSLEVGLYPKRRANHVRLGVFVKSDARGHVLSTQRVRIYSWTTSDEFVNAYATSGGFDFDAMRRAMRGRSLKY
jgi:hypothetical protein